MEKFRDMLGEGSNGAELYKKAKKDLSELSDFFNEKWSARSFAKWVDDREFTSSDISEWSSPKWELTSNKILSVVYTYNDEALGENGLIFRMTLGDDKPSNKNKGSDVYLS